jgi:hypothetical protein
MGTRLVIRTATDVNAEAIVSVHVAAWREAELRKLGAYCKPHHPKKHRSSRQSVPDPGTSHG